MAKLRSLMAICLALVLVFSPVSMVWAEGPGDTRVTGETSDGGDGHPWDDGTSEEPEPDGEENEVETDQLLDGPVFPMRTVTIGIGSWIEWTLTRLYRKVAVNARITKDESGPKMSPKKRGSRRPLR